MVPKMSSKQLANLEQHVKSDLKNISGIAGFYHSLTTMPKDVQTKLLREELLFDDTNKFFQSGGIYNHWPIGKVKIFRYIFFFIYQTHSKTVEEKRNRVTCNCVNCIIQKRSR